MSSSYDPYQTRSDGGVGAPPLPAPRLDGGILIGGDAGIPSPGPRRGDGGI